MRGLCDLLSYYRSGYSVHMPINGPIAWATIALLSGIVTACVTAESTAAGSTAAPFQSTPTISPTATVGTKAETLVPTDDSVAEPLIALSGVLEWSRGLVGAPRLLAHSRRVVWWMKQNGRLTLHLFELDTGIEVWSVNEMSDPDISGAFVEASADHRFIAAANLEGDIYVYDGATGAVIRSIRTNQRVEAIGFFDGANPQLIVATDSGQGSGLTPVSLWSLAGNGDGDIGYQSYAFVVLNGGPVVVLQSGGGLVFYDLLHEQEVGRVPLQTNINEIATSDDGSWLVAHGGDVLYSWHGDGARYFEIVVPRECDWNNSGVINRVSISQEGIMAIVRGDYPKPTTAFICDIANQRYLGRIDEVSDVQFLQGDQDMRATQMLVTPDLPTSANPDHSEPALQIWSFNP